MSEHQHQSAFVKWCDYNHIRVFAIPNGGARDAVTGAMLKAEGVKPGVPDLCIPIPSNDYHGLYIEMKDEKKGRLSPKQSEWLEFLNKQGYKAVVAHGFSEAMRATEEYFHE